MRRYYAGIFLISAATLLLEISLTRVFSVFFYHHFAFLIISTALFGFGFSGIFLFLSSRRDRPISNQLGLSSLLFAVSIVLAYKIILVLPYSFKEVLDRPVFLIRVILFYAILAVPFFFSGYVIGLLLSSFPSQAGKYYSFDLVGAASGCIAVLWLVPLLGASGAILSAALLASLAAWIFWPSIRWLRYVAFFALVGTGVLSWKAETYFSLPLSKIFQEKHGSFYGAPKRRIEYSAWSPVSHLDILTTYPNKLMYLDGGSNVSFLVRFNGKFDQLKPRINWRSVPYLISRRKQVCIIGPGGGEDVLIALSYKVDSITAVEMDPLIVNIVQGKYRDFIGGIFNHPSVRLINDEGRSFLRRSETKFDLIQTVHNCSPIAFASGALNLSESYLFTTEAFREYWRHLQPGGMLAINRAGILRAASIASVALQQEGIPDPENYVVVTSRGRGEGAGESGFYLKKGRIDREDIKQFQEARHTAKVEIVYAPIPLFETEENVYYNLLVPSIQRTFVREADVVLDAPTDNWPFFDHYQRLGRFEKRSRVLSEEINLEFYNLGDLALFTLMGEALVLSFLFILLPLTRLRRMEVAVSHWAILVYFAALGIGFILIEISLIQKHILFMGQPVYSISSVLFSLLLSAGIGSLFLQSRFRRGSERFWLGALAVSLLVLLIFEVWIVPKLFQYFLGTDRMVRFLLSGLFIAPLGFVLGIPFPLGIRILESRAPSTIPWGWGLNAYMTVVGSVLCVIFAVVKGFNLNFLVALCVYLLGLLFLYHSLPTRK